MGSMDTDILGFVAGIITTVSFVPQVVRVYRNKSGHDISFWMMLLLALGVILWLIYGFLLWSLPIILANAVTLVLVLAILVLKVYYARSRRY
jgi:MtN3 and saliva related transmembrane protein